MATAWRAARSEKRKCSPTGANVYFFTYLPSRSRTITRAKQHGIAVTYLLQSRPPSQECACWVDRRAVCDNFTDQLYLYIFRRNKTCRKNVKVDIADSRLPFSVAVVAMWLTKVMRIMLVCHGLTVCILAQQLYMKGCSVRSLL